MKLIKCIAQEILKIPNIQCYAKFINEKYTLNKSHYNDCKKDDINLNTKRICFIHRV